MSEIMRNPYWFEEELEIPKGYRSFGRSFSTVDTFKACLVCFKRAETS